MSAVQQVWDRFTAGLLVGAAAAGDLERAKLAMHEVIDSFPPEELDLDAHDPDMLAQVCGDLVVRTQRDLVMVVRELQGTSSAYPSDRSNVTGD